MKRIFTVLALCAIVFASRAQNNCQASWTATVDDSASLAVFIDNSTVQTGNIVSWVWEFGDGATGTGQQVTHQYNSLTSNYVVCLTITTDDSCSSSFCDSLQHCTYYHIISYVHPSIGNYDNGHISVSASGTPPFIYEWDNGWTGHVLDSLGPGIYCVTITDSDGCSDSACETMTISSDCEAEYTVDSMNANCGSNCWLFSDNSLGDSIISWTWTQDSLTIATGSEFEYTFPEPGEYYICLTIETAGGCVSTECHQNIIDDGIDTTCQAYFTYTGAWCGPGSYTFNDSSYTGGNNITSYWWNFGDGSSSAEANPLHIYTNNGNYHVCLHITTSNGCSSYYCNTITVSDIANPCNFDVYINTTGLTDSLSCNGTASVYAGSNTPGSGYSYLWSNGETTPSILNLCAGLYCITVSTIDGCQAEACAFIASDTNNAGPCYFLVDAVITNASGDSVADGAVHISVYGGTPPYSFVWNTGSTTQNLAGLTNGDYTVSVSDAQNCADQYTFWVGTVPINAPVDTLWTSPFDTCITVVDYYVDSVIVLDSNYITVNWVLINENGIESTLDVTYYYNQTGNVVVYLVISCDSLGKSVTTLHESIHIDYNMIVSVSVKKNREDWRIYPNPVQDVLTISVNPGKYNIQIFNITGQVIYNNSVETNSTFEVNTGNFSYGAYLLQLVSEKGEKFTATFCK
ncbi:MAG: PKD domain-containing protein [Bacteroidetes bacterium]|nr:PKD domain-containing protein [Bacteroidota bacterium]